MNIGILPVVGVHCRYSAMEGHPLNGDVSNGPGAECQHQAVLVLRTAYTTTVVMALTSWLWAQHRQSAALPDHP